jgi:thiamine pyrophosphate-dependent acetolactate synthase large subunit-like protein
MIGDGSFGFTAGELETIARLELPILTLVISNGAFGWIKAGQKSGYRERYFAVRFPPHRSWSGRRRFRRQELAGRGPGRIAPGPEARR